MTNLQLTQKKPEVDECAVRTKAYELWQRRGCPANSPEQDWFEALRLLAAPLIAHPTSASERTTDVAGVAGSTTNLSGRVGGSPALPVDFGSRIPEASHSAVASEASGASALGLDLGVRVQTVDDAERGPAQISVSESATKPNSRGHEAPRNGLKSLGRSGKNGRRN